MYFSKFTCSFYPSSHFCDSTHLLFAQASCASLSCGPSPSSSSPGRHPHLHLLIDIIMAIRSSSSSWSSGRHPHRHVRHLQHGHQLHYGHQVVILVIMVVMFIMVVMSSSLSSWSSGRRRSSSCRQVISLYSPSVRFLFFLRALLGTCAAFALSLVRFPVVYMLLFCRNESERI